MYGVEQSRHLVSAMHVALNLFYQVATIACANYTVRVIKASVKQDFILHTHPQQFIQ